MTIGEGKTKTDWLIESFALQLNSLFSPVLLLTQHPSNCESHALPLPYHSAHFTPTWEQTPTILQVLHWGSNLLLTEQCTVFQENHGLTLGGADSHASLLTHGCKPPQCAVKVTVWWSQWDQIISRKQNTTMSCSNWTLSSPQLHIGWKQPRCLTSY